MKTLSYVMTSLLFIFGVPTWCAGVGYPEKPITMIVPFTTGGANDLDARAVAPLLEESLKQAVVVVNKAGANTLLGGNAVATAKPDGYTIGGAFSVIASLPETFNYFQKSPYTSNDLTPICLMTRSSGVLIVKSDSQWKNMKEFVEYARKSPGAKIGSHGGPGSIPNLMLMEIEKAENIKFSIVPMEGNAANMTAVLGGHLPIAVSNFATVRQQVEAKNLRVLLFLTDSRSELMPEVQCAKDIGYDLPAIPFSGYFGPKNLPHEITEKINNALKNIAHDPRYKKTAESLGLEIVYEGPESFKKTLLQYRKKLEEFYRKLGFWKD